MTVANAYGMLVTITQSGTVLWRGPEVLGYRLTRTGSTMRLETFDGTGYTAVPEAAALTGPVRFDNASKTHRLWSMSGRSRTYRGIINVHLGASRLDAIIDLPLEDYLRGVVPLEMPASWPAEALKAQTVAARTYAARAIDANTSGRPYDICDTQACQVFGGTTTYSQTGVATSIEDTRTDAAIAGTAGVVLKYAGATALTEFSSSNGGWSVASSVPYQVAAADPWDGLNANPHVLWAATLPVSVLEARWPSIGVFRRLVVVSRDGHGAWGGRLLSVRLEGSIGSVTVSGEALRSARPYNTFADGLRSSWFTITNAREPLGQLDTAFGGSRAVAVTGWAIDFDTIDPIAVHVYIDGSGYQLIANGSRPDVGAAYPGFGNAHGYQGTFAAAPGTHQVCAYAINVLTGAGNNPVLGCTLVQVFGNDPLGQFESVTGGSRALTVAGWAFDPDTNTPIDVHVYIDAAGYAVRANLPRSDLAAAFPLFGPNHAFQATLPAAAGVHRVCVYAINVQVGAGNNPGLGCRAVTVAP
ncbi:MAG: SpoIID/LytB domain-containing protein [Actinomycetales bacterium]|nr:SpoIID/LytB domain-containing protein [Actinomycetales bacterium]